MRKLIVRYSGVNQSDITQNIVSVSGVNATLQVGIIDAVIVDVEEGREQDVENQLLSFTGVRSVERDQQLVPMVADPDLLDEFLDTVAARRGYEIPIEGEVSISADDDISASEEREFFGADGTIEYIGVDSIREKANGGAGVIAANVDTGACGEQFADERMMSGFDARGDDPWSDDNGHGSYTLGIMAGDENTDGLEVGCAPNADLYPLRTTFAGSELLACADHISTLAEKESRPIIINNSWGHVLCDGSCDTSWTEAFAEAAQIPNVYMVFAAGNEALKCGQACDTDESNGINAINSREEVLTVGATGRAGNPDELQAYSSRGPGACGNDPTKPEVSAPIYGEVPWKCGSKNIGNRGGTSGACPHVAGVVALTLSNAGGTVPQSAVFGSAMNTANQFQGSGWNNCSGYGNIDAEGTVEGAQGIRIPSAVADAAVAVSGIAGPFALTELQRNL